MIKALYNLTVTISVIFFHVFSWVKPKWRARAKGLRNQRITASKVKRIWFHCASAGEYEQIAQVINILQQKLPHHPIFISFFSASGEEWMKAKNIQHEYAYLPFDQISKMKSFIKEINPKFIVIAKNEFWANMLNELNKASIPIFMVSAKITDDFVGLKNKFFKNSLSHITSIYTQDEYSRKLLQPYVSRTKTTGDTRISQILSKSNTVKEDSPFENEKQIIIYGSLHKEDSGVLNAINKFSNFNHIIVPHDISEKAIAPFKDILGPNPPLSTHAKKTKNNFIIINEIGRLAGLYHLSDYTYIGGGFSKGIHNIIEPLAQGNIVCIGPRYQKFIEAKTLIEEKAVSVIENPKDFPAFLSKIVGTSNREIKTKRDIAIDFIGKHRNAAAKVAEDIMNLTSK